ncbi:MAG TPA: histidine phosphatase family protein [Thiotrichales bacterium]|nr:histidine phosphatase family protein [Thiotrichales bacterium]
MLAGVLRHGETKESGRFIGCTDSPLTPRGWRQMERAVAAAGRPWQRVVTSPLSRCARFACHFAVRHSLPLEEEPRLRELDFGEWEGKSAEEILASDAASLERFWNDPWNHPPPGGEPLALFRERVLEAWEAMCHSAGRGDPLVVTHGGVIRLLLCHLEGRPPRALLSREVPLGSLHLLNLRNPAAGAVTLGGAG